MQLKPPELPPDYVSLAILRERWLKRQKEKKEKEEEDEAKKNGECGEGCVEDRDEGEKSGGGVGDDGVDDDCEKGGGVEERRGNVERFGRREKGYGYVMGNERDLGEVSRGFGDRRRAYDEGRIGGREIGVRRRAYDEGRFGGREIGGGRYGGDRRRFGGRKERIEVGVSGNVVGGKRVEVSKGYGNRRFDEGEGVGGDRRRFGKGLWVGKEGREVEKRNVVGGKLLEGFKGESRRINDGEGVGGDRRRFGKGNSEVVRVNVGDGKRRADFSRGYGDRRGDDGDYVGGDHRRFGKGLGVGKEEGEVEKRNVGVGKMEGFKGDVNRRINEGEGIGGDHWRIGKGLGVGKRENEVEKRNVVSGEVLEGSKGYGKRKVNEEGDVGGKFGGLEMDGGRKGSLKYGGDRRRFGKGLIWKGENEDEKRNVVDVRDENVVNVKALEGSKGCGNMRINEVEDVGEKFGGLEISGGRKGGDKYGGDRKRFGKVLGVWKGRNEVEKRDVADVREENVVDVTMLEGSKDSGERQMDKEVEIGEKFRGLLRNGRRKGKVKFGRDRRGFGKVSGVGKGENVVEKQNVVDVGEESEVVKGNVVDVRDENVVDGKMSEVSNGYKRSIAADMGRKFGNSAIIGGERQGKFRSGGDRRRFRPRTVKIYVRVRKENEVEKPIPVAVREENEVEKPIVVAVSGENEVEKQNLVYVKEKNDDKKQIPVAVRDENEVEKQNRVEVKKENDVKNQIPVAVRDENEVEKQNLVNVKEENDVKKQIPVAVRDENEVVKQNLVDDKMLETSKGFGHRPPRGNEAIRGKSEDLSDNGWRKGNVKYGRDRGRFGSWKNKQKKSGMMWVKKCDAGAADKQAQVERADVK